jgi:hypothetical protein
MPAPKLPRPPNVPARPAWSSALLELHRARVPAVVVVPVFVDDSADAAHAYVVTSNERPRRPANVPSSRRCGDRSRDDASGGTG